ncbi:MAG TPA: Fe(3+) ABC transporter substrate-binding protein [Paracoccaceae bacterium]|nr:Fe(3+) ABC transporter substrate-binding protein [Paracoccaceae bacterium]
MTRPALSVAALAAALLTPAFAAANGELNLYSSRHYDTDERLYSDFEEMTGITVNRIEAGADELIERMKAEGANSPADVLLTVDAGRMWRADQAGLLQPVESEVLERRVPDYLQHPENHWFAFSQRARIIFYDEEDVADPPLTYADLADPRYEGMVCTRSSSNIYMLSLMASIIEHQGEEAAREWAEGVWNNRARDPQGGDTDQLRAVVSGECDIVVSNTYYFARALRKDVEGVTGSTEMFGWTFPNQSSTGTHVNVSVGGVAANAPNRENAVRFLEYLASDAAQEYFSAGNDEYPAVPGVALAPSVAELGYFRSDDLNLSALGENQAQAQMIYDSVGYE